MTETGGKDVGAEVGKHVIDWKYLGKTYTWNVVNFRTGKTTSWFTGSYADKGYRLEDGTYKTDAELAEVAA